MPGNDNSPGNVLRTSTAILAELNRELEGRLEELPPDIRILLAQKGAVTQCVMRECCDLLDQAAGRLARHDEVLALCRRWRDQFLIPLKQQSDGASVTTPVYTTHLDEIIRNLDTLLDSPPRPGASKTP